MKSIYRTFAAAATLACLTSISTVASAEIINFDDLTNGPAFFSSAYHGLTFGDTGSNPPVTGGGNWFWSDKAPPTALKSPFTSVSTEAVLDANGQPIKNFSVEKDSEKISATSPFRFGGAWFSGLDDNITVKFDYYLANVLIGSSAALNLGLVGASDSTPYKFLASGFSGQMDAFSVHGLQGYFAMDDLAINVPEPTSYALVLAALGAMTMVKRRKNA